MDKYIGRKFLDFQGTDMEVMEKYNDIYYLVKSINHNWERKCGDLMTDEDIESYLSKQEQIKESLEWSRKRQEEEDRAAEEAERKRIEAEDLYGYDAAMTDMQRGKVVKILLKSIFTNGHYITRKDFIVNRILNGSSVRQVDGVVTSYGSKWDRKESKPKTEYRLYEPDSSFYIITKTEYDFAQYIQLESLIEGTRCRL